MNKHISSIGIVLGRINYSEADRIITLLTRDHGKLTTMAKGIRKPKSRKRGSLEIFSKVKISVSKYHGMGLITEAQIIDYYNEIRSDLNKLSLAYYYCEVINKITSDNDHSEDLFNILDKYLSLLKSSNNLKSQRFSFLHDLLVDRGFWTKESKIPDPDKFIENILERKINSIRVGKIIQNF